MSQASASAKPPISQSLAGAGIEHRIEVLAPPVAVWALLEDVGGWGRWNPLYASASGSIVQGEALDFTIVLPGMKPQNGSATVRVAAANAQLHYEITGLGGLLRTTRYVEIEPTGAARCVVVNGELMRGLLSPLVVRALGDRVRAGLQGMSEALKTTAEANWRKRPGS